MLSGSDLKKLRVIDLNWSQKKFANELNVSQAIISSIENGLVKPTEKFIKKLDKLKKQQKIRD